MHDTTTLYGQISQAIRWNAFSYTVFKLTNTALTFVLYKQLSTAQFALWAGINSLVYLALLWADFGMRKTIPTFFPLIEESNRAKCITILVSAYTGILALICPFTVWLVMRYACSINLPMNTALLASTVLLFFGHGLEMLFQTMFHAYLWHKAYNSLLATIQCTYMILVIIATFMYNPSYDMLLYIILGKGIASLACALLSALLLKKRMPSTPKDHKPYAKEFLEKFLRHAGLMWVATVFKSFSERNITVPFVTYAAGPTLGNLFKVSQDGALLLQRLIFRTIGTTDTSLFAHLKNTHQTTEHKQIFQEAFSKLATKLAYLVLPLIGLVWFMQCQITCCGTQDIGFQLFFIISIALLLELLLTPYERILEVHANYNDLAIAYIIYSVGIGATFVALAHGYIQLIPFVIALYSVRLLAMAIMGWAAYNKYCVQYPFKKIGLLLAITICLTYILHLLIYQFCGTGLVSFFLYFFNFSS